MGQRISFNVNGVEVSGYLAEPENMQKQAPLIMVFHEWWGLSNT